MGRLAVAAVIPYLLVAAAIVSFILIAARRAIIRARRRGRDSRHPEERSTP